MAQNPNQNPNEDILEEVRRIKEELAAAMDFDIDRILADALKRQAVNKRPVISPTQQPSAETRSPNVEMSHLPEGFQDSVTRFRLHADGTPLADDARNLADFLWMARRTSNSNLTSGAVWEAVVAELEELNSMLKSMPSDSELPRQLLYAINGMITKCLEFVATESLHPSREAVLHLARRIAFGWDCVLAGDIESIENEVTLHEYASSNEIE